MHEPDGYPGPNDASIAAALASDGRLVSFCRLDPRVSPAEEARRCLDAGAVGIKLHPRAEQFTMARAGRARDRRGRPRAARADPDPRGARDSRSRARTRCELATEFPDARLILAHAAISDLAWLWHVLPDHPNVFIDTAWWNPADHIALFSLVDPSHIVWASDSPYGLPVLAAWTHARCALQAGVGDEALRCDHGRPDRAARHGPGPAVGRRRAGRRPRRRCTRCWTASSPTWSRRSAAPSAAATPTSRWRWRASPARSARTPRTPTSAPPCWSCSTSTASTSPRRPRAARSRWRGRFIIAALTVARTPAVAAPAGPAHCRRRRAKRPTPKRL